MRRLHEGETRGILRGETEEEEVSLRDVDYGLYYLLIERFLIIYIQIVHNIHKVETIQYLAHGTSSYNITWLGRLVVLTAAAPRAELVQLAGDFSCATKLSFSSRNDSDTA